ncbi:probable serine/threonine-protein kinase clkA [Paramacrobiotus metropolitanus]|uniref:probable serine/threonine-protein kinase clkA n=1 Tax=Paramacrobiotus metropolitanus TaxID=2943436 RepID=UPI002445AFA7|nr:probable serine/threonine-protein kinase clkA [Paramacrobiotus metropolitanus]
MQVCKRFKLHRLWIIIATAFIWSLKIMCLVNGQLNPPAATASQFNNAPGTGNPRLQNATQPVTYNYTWHYGPDGKIEYDYEYQVGNSSAAAAANQPVVYNYTWHYGPDGNIYYDYNYQVVNSSAAATQPFNYTYNYDPNGRVTYDYNYQNNGNMNQNRGTQPAAYNYTYYNGQAGNAVGSGAQAWNASYNYPYQYQQGFGGANPVAGRGNFNYNYYQTNANFNPSGAQPALYNYTYYNGQASNSFPPNRGTFGNSNAPFGTTANGYNYSQQYFNGAGSMNSNNPGPGIYPASYPYNQQVGNGFFPNPNMPFGTVANYSYSQFNGAAGNGNQNPVPGLNPAGYPYNQQAGNGFFLNPNMPVGTLTNYSQFSGALGNLYPNSQNLGTYPAGYNTGINGYPYNNYNQQAGNGIFPSPNVPFGTANNYNYSQFYGAGNTNPNPGMAMYAGGNAGLNGYPYNYNQPTAGFTTSQTGNTLPITNAGFSNFGMPTSTQARPPLNNNPGGNLFGGAGVSSASQPLTPSQPFVNSQVGAGIGPNSYQQPTQNSVLGFPSTSGSLSVYNPAALSGFSGLGSTNGNLLAAVNAVPGSPNGNLPQTFFSTLSNQQPYMSPNPMTGWQQNSGVGPNSYQQPFPNSLGSSYPFSQTSNLYTANQAQYSDLSSNSRNNLNFANFNGGTWQTDSNTRNPSDLMNPQQRKADYYVNGRNQLVQVEYLLGTSRTVETPVASNVVSASQSTDGAVWIIDTNGRFSRLRYPSTYPQLEPNQPRVRFVRVSPRSMNEALALTDTGDLYHFIGNQWLLDTSAMDVGDVGIGDDGTELYVDQYQRIFIWDWRTGAWIPYEVNGKGFDIYDANHVIVYDNSYNVRKRINGRWVWDTEKCKDVRLLRNNYYYCMTLNNNVRLLPY